ncbi:MAG: CoA-binding protein [Spirochaetes bacterium]|nr:CoA-binding protein [Spirochaetota bacterium]
MSFDAVDSFKKIFEPRSIAIIGVATKGFGFGRGILLSLLAYGYSGTLYPVNPKGGEIKGLPIYKSVEDIPGMIDFGIIAVPAPDVPDAVEACRKKGAAAVEILSSGFTETGAPEGARLEERLSEIAKTGIRIIGPNCFGVHTPRGGLTFLPGPDLSRDPGSVAFISQSGGHSIDFAHMGRWKGVAFSKMISLGNGIDLRETELLRYLADDPETEIIGMYIEGVRDGKAFFHALRDAASRKPVIILKGGLSESGSRAVLSHTASMGGSSVIWKSVIRQCNAIQAYDLHELSDYALAFSMLPHGEYRNVSIVGGGGALGVSAADMAEQYGMRIPELAADIREEIDSLLPKPGSSARNPIDIANPYVTPEVLREILVKAARDDAIDAQIVIQLLYHYKALAISYGAASVKPLTPFRELAETIGDVVRTTNKPVIMVLPDLKQELESMEVTEMIRETRKILTAMKIPVFNDLHSAVRSLHALSTYARKKQVRQA